MRASKLMRFHSMPSATGGIAHLVCARLRVAGIALAPLLSRAALTAEQIDAPGLRLTVHSQIKLLELGAEALPDDVLGFHLAQDYDLREIGYRVGKAALFAPGPPFSNSAQWWARSTGRVRATRWLCPPYGF